MNFRTIRFATLALVLGASTLPCHGQQPPGGASTTTPAKIQVPAAVGAKANDPKPGAKASKKASIGKGKAAASTSNAAGDEDSFWVENVDIDGDGTAEETDVLWDDEDKVMFFYAQGDFPCANGGTGSGDLLVAVNGTGNARGKPAGSGWYLVTLDEGECKAEAVGAYGCKFDAKGNATACGMAAFHEKNDELVIATASS